MTPRIHGGTEHDETQAKGCNGKSPVVKHWLQLYPLEAITGCRAFSGLFLEYYKKDYSEYFRVYNDLGSDCVEYGYLSGWYGVKVVLITDSFVSDLPAPDDLKHISDLLFDENGGLCGSKLTMDMACRNIMAHTNCGIAQAFLMASRNPAKAIGMDDEIGTIEVGKKANLVFVDDMFHVKKVILNGKEVNRC